MAHDDRYLEFLRSIPPFSKVRRSSLPELARLVDDVWIPARASVRPARCELVILADGTMVSSSGGVVVRGRVLGPCTATALTDTRLLVIGPRALPGVLEVPGLDRALFDATRAGPVPGPTRADTARTAAGTLLR